MRARNARIMYLLLLTTFIVNFAGLGNKSCGDFIS